MKFASLGSGSEGNALLISSGCSDSATHLMLDCGFVMREVERRLARLQIDPAQLSGILVTHEHSDHLGGVFRMARRHRIPVWLSHGTFEAGRADSDGVDIRICRDSESFTIGSLEVQPYTVPHDAREPVQYRFGDGNVRLGVLTDIGHPTAHVAQVLSGCEALVLECNYDPQMLDDGPYPAWLKRRVGGKQGHLSNQQSAELLAVLDRSRLRHLVAAHLSRTNNTPALARGALVEVLGFEPAWLEMASQTAAAKAAA